ncbi:unnamed protein product [Blepharisma stoltei]|uniref:non-specific serine/threonine protein kinase n=1 Tax=Blepharisma stoltei TaxID=1481888 RepID=A0AAU9JXR6_9CILI|nr:unnamed protein product [Blepharisma stoltei]
MSNFKRLDQYIVLHSLGKGATAHVKAVEDPTTHQIYAAKIMKSYHGSGNEELKETIQNEMENLNSLAHPNIVNLICVNESGTYAKRNGQTKRVMYMLMELCPNGELFDVLYRTGKFSEEITRFYFHQLIETLEAVHNQGITHRDIKPENILFDRDFNLKISDFGFSTLIDKYADGMLYTQLGTQGYMAPEIHQNLPYRGEIVDLFAAGIVLFIMYTQNPPFTKAVPNDPFYRLLSKKDDKFWVYHSRNKTSDFFTQDFKNLIFSMLALQPNDRLPISHIKAHPWYNGPVATTDEIVSELRKRKEKIIQAAQKAAKAKNLGNRPGAINNGGRVYRCESGEPELAGQLSLQIEDLVVEPLPEHFNTVNRFYQIISGIDPQDIVTILARSFQNLDTEWNPSHDKYEFEVTIRTEVDTLNFVISIYSMEDELNLISFKLNNGSKFEFMSIFKTIEDNIFSAQESY